MAIADLNVERVLHLSQRGALEEVTEEKAEKEAQVEQARSGGCLPVGF
jgi:hypothetical protein